MSAVHPADRTEKLPILVDLDGTIFESTWTPENRSRAIGALIPSAYDKLEELVWAGHELQIHTSRPAEDLPLIVAALDDHDMLDFFTNIHTDKPLGELYVDDKARHCDDVTWLPPNRRVSS